MPFELSVNRGCSFTAVCACSSSPWRLHLIVLSVVVTSKFGVSLRVDGLESRGNVWRLMESKAYLVHMT